MWVCYSAVRFLCNRNKLSNESCNATTTRHSIIAKLARFCFKALLSSYSMMCSPSWPLSVNESPMKTKLPTTNYLSPWENSICITRQTMTQVKFRKQVLKLCNLDLGALLESLSISLAHTQVLIVLLSLLCTLTVLLEYTKLQLGCIVYYCYLHACMQSSMIIASLACLTLLPIVYQGVELKNVGCVKVGIV